jgi:ADP-ribosylglycohydrolase
MEHLGNKLLPVIAYGDAAGLPVETLSSQEIADRYGRVESLLPTTENPFFSGEHIPGCWSDDCQPPRLANTLSRSLSWAA